MDLLEEFIRVTHEEKNKYNQTGDKTILVNDSMESKIENTYRSTESI